MAPIKRLFPITLICLLLLSESFPVSSADYDQDWKSLTGILHRNVLHPLEHQRLDKDTGSSLAEKISIKRGARSAVIGGHSSISSSSRVPPFNIASVICFVFAFAFALLP
ncbi:hypothetical protein SDJN03_16379, partial [Cucurbita argyrosperma subsp. sororia]